MGFDRNFGFWDYRVNYTTVNGSREWHVTDRLLPNITDEIRLDGLLANHDYVVALTWTGRITAAPELDSVWRSRNLQLPMSRDLDDDYYHGRSYTFRTTNFTDHRPARLNVRWDGQGHRPYVSFQLDVYDMGVIGAGQKPRASASIWSAEVNREPSSAAPAVPLPPVLAVGFLSLADQGGAPVLNANQTWPWQQEGGMLAGS